METPNFNNANLKRKGYTGFLSMCWMLWKMRRNNKKFGVTTRIELDL